MKQKLHTVKFKDESLEDSFQRYGYIHIKNFLSSETVKELYCYWKSIYEDKNEHENQWNSLYNIGYEKGNKSSLFIIEQIKNSFDNYFKDFDIPAGTFLVKKPIKGSVCTVHRDFTTYDERIVQFRNYWIPLVNTTKKNGALYVIPGSHHVFKAIRPMFSEWAYEPLKNEIMDYKKIIYAGSGDLILMAEKMLHGSLENKTDSPRPVLQGGLLPKNTQLYYYTLNNNIVYKYKVNPEFYFKNLFHDLSMLKTYELEEVFQFKVDNISSKEIKKLKTYKDSYFKEIYSKLKTYNSAKNENEGYF